MRQSPAEVVVEYGAFPGVEEIAGVTYDGTRLRFAAGHALHAVEPAGGEVARSIDMAAQAGTAFDRQHPFRIADQRIQKSDPETGAVLGTLESNRFVTGVTCDDGEQWHASGEDDASERLVRRP